MGTIVCYWQYKKIDNININNVKKIKYFIQRLRYGFDERVVWDLEIELAKIILPRLVFFKNSDRKAHPIGISPKTWEKILDKMILAFELILSEFEEEKMPSKKEWLKRDKQIDEGLELFGKHFRDLWD